MNKVIDTSSYNGEVNFKSAKSQGVDGAILKIIRKDLGYDKQFLNSQKSCEENKLPWGVYNYSYATTVSKAKSDMKLVCDILDKLSSKKYFTLGVWFDIEDEVQAKLSKTSIANIINAAQSVVESRGYEFGIYTGLAYYKAHMDAQSIFCKNWWIARYYKGYTEMKFATNPNESYKPLNDCFAWQYTSSGTFNPKICSGNNGHVDISVLYRDFKGAKKLSDIVVGSARIDENGKTTGGTAGDQKQTSSVKDTKGEVSMQSFYVHTKGWNILRPKSVTHANAIASKMIVACNNKNVGYDQGNRLGIIKYGTDAKTKTECDCSSLVRECIKEATGKDVGNFTTANEADILEKSGLFEKKVAYVSLSKTPIYNGDVLVTKTKGHTVIVVSGSPRKSTSSTSSNSSTTKTSTIDESWKGNTKYYLENSRVGTWQNAMNIGFDVKTLDVDNKFGDESQAFASTHILWSGQKHNCITAIKWLRKILRDTYGFDKLSYDGYWDSYLTTCVKTFQKNRGLTADGVVGLITTYWLLEGTVK